MEDIYELLMSFDYPDAILPGMRRRQDMVRGVLEKTRGDLTTALRQQKLERALERAKRRAK
jgi:translin